MTPSSRGDPSTLPRRAGAPAGGGRPDAKRSAVEEELDRLWSAFRRSRSSKARDSLLLHYAPLVKYVASRLATGLPSAVEQGDLVSYGIFGLMDALDKFDPGRGNKFETYAIQRIRGAIIDELRALDWVPRSVRLKARQLEKAQGELEARLKRAPSDSEIARHLGMPLPELHRTVMQISFASLVALEDVGAQGSDRLEGVSLLHTLTDLSADPTAGLEEEETREMLAAAIRDLSDRERTVVTLYYFDGLTLGQVGEVLGVTESRVCQIHAKAVGRLRQQLLDQG